MTVRKALLHLLVPAILGAVAFTSWAVADDAVKNVVLIGWDGTQRAHLQEMIGRNEVPNLVALSKEGALVDIDITSGATDTKAGWTQILTGYKPDKTGVFSNTKFQPIPEGYTVFERLKTALGQDNIAALAVLGKRGNLDTDAPVKEPYDQWLTEHKTSKRVSATTGRVTITGGHVVQENGVNYVVIYGKPYYNTQKHMDVWINGLEKNEKVGATAISTLEKYKDKRFCCFIQFAQPDTYGHKYGENSQEYTDAIKADDAWTGSIVAKLKELGLYDKTLVYVTADHGYNEGLKSYSYAPYVFLATNDKKVTRNGDRSDIAPTILKRFGVDLTKLQPALDGIALDEPAPERKAPPTNPNTRQRKARGAKTMPPAQ